MPYGLKSTSGQVSIYGWSVGEGGECIKIVEWFFLFDLNKPSYGGRNLCWGIQILNPSFYQNIQILHIISLLSCLFVPTLTGELIAPHTRRVGLSVVVFKHLDFEKSLHHQNSPEMLSFGLRL